MTFLSRSEEVLTYIFTYLLTYSLTPWSRALLEKLTGSQLVKKLLPFHGTRRFITAFTSVRHLSLSWASSIQSITPQTTSWKSILYCSPPTPGSPRRSLSLKFPHQNPVYVSPLPHTRYVPRPSHSSRFYHPNNIGWAVQIRIDRVTKGTQSSHDYRMCESPPAEKMGQENLVEPPLSSNEWLDVEGWQLANWLSYATFLCS